MQANSVIKWLTQSSEWVERLESKKLTPLPDPMSNLATNLTSHYEQQLSLMAEEPMAEEPMASKLPINPSS